MMGVCYYFSHEDTLLKGGNLRKTSLDKYDAVYVRLCAISEYTKKITLAEQGLFIGR